MKMDAVTERGRILSAVIRFSLSVENNRTDAGRGGRTCRARPNSSVWLTMRRIGNHTRLIHTLLKVLNIQYA